jgi:hypothetical protein
VKTILSIFIFFSVLTVRQSTAPEEKVDPAKEALAVVTWLFEAMQTKDADGIRATFVPDGQLAVTQKRTGQTTVQGEELIPGKSRKVCVRTLTSSTAMPVKTDIADKPNA